MNEIEAFFAGLVLVIGSLGGRDALKYYIDRRWPKTVKVKCGSKVCKKVILDLK